MRRWAGGIFAGAGAVLLAAEFEALRAAAPWLAPAVYVAKPLATGLLAAAAFSTPGADPRYRRRIGIGLLWSLAGDVFLMLPGDWFVPGLASFLVAHLCYLAGFTAGRRFPGTWSPILPLGAVAAALLAALRPGLGGLAGPVTGYVVAIVTMAWQAAARAIEWRRAPDRLAAAGAVAFLVSDGLLAWNRFRAPFPGAGFGVMLTYLAAQLAIAGSVRGSARPAGATDGRDGTPAAPAGRR